MLKKSCGVGRWKPWAQVKPPPAWSPCEKRFVTFACSESYFEFPVGELEGSSAPNCGNGYNVLSSEELVGNPAYGDRLVNPRADIALTTAGLLIGWPNSR